MMFCRLTSALGSPMLFLMVMLCFLKYQDGTPISTCPHGCSCKTEIGTSSDSYLADCSSLGLVTVPLNIELPSGTLILNLTNNNITSLTKSSFDAMEYLEKLMLMKNKINFISKDAFHGLSSLQELYFEKFLGDFLTNSTGHGIDLSFNQLAGLHHNLFTNLYSLSRLRLTGNPWNCNCTVIWLQNWINNNSEKIPDLNEVLCYSPSVYTGLSLLSANLSTQSCATNYVSCAWNVDLHAVTLVWWDYLERNSTLYNEDKCAKICFRKGYYYASIIEKNDSCLCAYKSEDVVSHSATCFNICLNSKTDSCPYTVLDNIFLASPELKFSGLKVFSQLEEVNITVHPKRFIFDTLLWMFNDSTPTLMTSELVIQHKYAIPGNYWVTVTAQNGFGVDIYSLFLVVQAPVLGISLACPTEIYIEETTTFNITLISGSSLFLSWKIWPDLFSAQTDSTCCMFNSVEVCYKWFNLSHTWSDSQVICQQNGGDLAVIDSNALQELINNNMPPFGLFWIGVHKVTKGTLTFINGKEMSNANISSVYGESNISLKESPKNCIATNNSGKWLARNCWEEVGFICQYYSAESVSGPKDFLVGTGVFQHSYMKTVNTMPVFSETATTTQKYVLLLPGLWLSSKATLISWELVAQSSAFPLYLQVYRPSCPDTLKLIPPGCKGNPFSTCADKHCAQQESNCSVGKQWCVFNISSDHCRPLDEPCNWYMETNIKKPARHLGEVPNYSLVYNQPIMINETGVKLYQFVFNNTVELEKHDVIGIGFSAITFDKDLSKLPLKCKNSSLSSWRQSGLLYSLLQFGDLHYNSNEVQWLDNIWCDVRLHASQPSQTFHSISNLIPTHPGIYNFSATVFNTASLGTMPSDSCKVSISEKSTKKNKMLSSTIRNSEEVEISNATILPVGIKRILVGITQKFTASWSTGENVSIAWIVDDLDQFKLCQPAYYLLFRKPSTYKLTVVLSNSRGSVNTSVDLLVDRMNKLTNLKFVQFSTIAQFEALTLFQIEVLVDKNINATVSWIFGTHVEETTTFYSPYENSTGVEQILLTDKFEKNFSSPGSQLIKVSVSNEFDYLETEINVDVRKPLLSINIEVLKPAVSKNITTVGIFFSPHHKTVFDIYFGDSSIETTIEDNDFTFNHSYVEPGVFNLTVLANNTISTLVTWKLIEVFEIITDLQLFVEPFSELGYPSNISAVIRNGWTENITISVKFGDNTSISVPGLKVFNTSHQYAQDGIYNISFEAKNSVSQFTVENQTIIFILQIKNVIFDKICYNKSSDVTMLANVTSVSFLFFEFHWTFDGGLENKTVLSNSSVNITSGLPGIYNGNVTVVNLETFNNVSKNFVFCVQESVQNVSMSMYNGQKVIAVGETVWFYYDIHGGTNLTVNISFGDETFEQLLELNGNISHIYSSEGIFKPAIHAFNLVSSLTVIDTIVCQLKISGLKVSTSSAYGTAIARGHNITYTALYIGSDVSVIWKFGDGSLNKIGDKVNHIYKQDDDFFITVTAQNNVSLDNLYVRIVVESPIEGVEVSQIDPVVLEGSFVWLNFSSIGNANGFCWNISPGLPATWVKKSSDPFFLHQFQNPGEFVIHYMAENGVSAQNFSRTLIVAANITSLFIVSNSTKNGYGGIHTQLEFETFYGDYAPIISSTMENILYISIYWEIVTSTGQIFKNSSNSSTIDVTFTETGNYTIYVNVSNTVMSKTVFKPIIIIQAISNITLTKLDNPLDAVQTGYPAQILVTSEGSNVIYTWSSRDIFSNIGPLFNHTYTVAGAYTIDLTIENPLGKYFKQYSLQVQDHIYGLRVDHMNSIVPFYVPFNNRSLFRASVFNGSNVIYKWEFHDIKNGIKSESKLSNHGQINWNFSEITTYLMMVNASNLVSWDSLNTTVYVMAPVTGLAIYLETKITGISFNFTMSASVTPSENAIYFDFNFGDGTALNKQLLGNSSSKEVVHRYLSPGIFEASVLAYNNASELSETFNISVREKISGLKILGVENRNFIISGKPYNLTASVESGSDIVFIWSVETKSGVELHNGRDFILVTNVGEVALSLTADNIVFNLTEKLILEAQAQPNVEVRLLNSEKAFTNQNITLEIIVHSGTSVQHLVDFDEVGNIQNISGTVAFHSYSTPGHYAIHVISYNQASQVVQTINVTIGELKCEKPDLVFVNNGANQFYRSRKVYIETEINTFGCTEYIVLYVWRIYQKTSCEYLSENDTVKIPPVRNPLLVLSPLTLDIGSYCVTCTASFFGTPLTHTISTPIEIISTPLAVIINGGTFRFVTQALALVLDASSSFDPDLDSDEQTQLNYNWTCTSKKTKLSTINSEIYSKLGDSCFSWKMGETIELPSQEYLPGIEYNFTVAAYKKGKAPVSSWQSVIFVQSVIPTVTITCISCRKQSSLQTSSAHHLILLGSCESCERQDEVTYLWEATCRNSSQHEPMTFPLTTVTTTTGAFGKYLVVRVGAMQSYFEYEFKLTITVRNLSGVSKLVLYANKPPVNGNCTLSYAGSHIYVLETLVRFQCFGWEDEDISLLVYTILAIRYKHGSRVDDFIIYRGTSSVYEAYLPLGFKDNNYNVTIQVIVEDELGTYSVGLNESIIVELSPMTQTDTIIWLHNKTFGQLSELQKSSNPQLVADFAAGLITVLNEDSEVYNAEDDSSFNSRKEIRNKITRTVTSLEANTLDEIQQVTTVFKQCVKVSSEFQDSDLQNVSMHKFMELAVKMPNHIESASQTTILTVTTTLMDIASYLVDSFNYPVYINNNVITSSNIGKEEYRKEMVEQLMNSTIGLTTNVLNSKVEGEEPFFLNATAMSSIGARTTPANMNRSVINDGCLFEFPKKLFCNVSEDSEISYILVVAEQNPYTYGYIPSHLAKSGHAKISTRVPAFQFKYANQLPLSICTVEDMATIEPTQWIKMTMAPSKRQFIQSENTGEIESNVDGIEFSNFTLNGLQSGALTIHNNNSDPSTAVYIVVMVFEQISVSNTLESAPYIDIFYHTRSVPDSSNYIIYKRLDTLFEPTADYKNYTIYLNSSDNNNLHQSYYLNITSYFKYHNTRLGVAVYYSSCQFYDPSVSLWSSKGLATSPETVPSAAVCYSSHLTSFGSFILSPPNIIDITEIRNIDFSQNPVALITVVIIFSLYIVGAIRCRILDIKDLEKASSIPLCGKNGPYKYEVTIKTSPGIGCGTSANVGINIYGYHSKSGSRHLFRQGAFHRGSVDVFQIACDIDLGPIYKIKLWHDNTGLDPAWNVTRIMLKDMQTEENFYFLADTWLQVYPDDEDDTCLQKTIRIASDDELSNFSLRFGNQLSYGWEDVHLWMSLVERPTKSHFTRIQRLTCCVTLLYSFMVLCAFWYQGDGESLYFFKWQDIAVGVIVTIMVFPVNIFIVLCFKNSKSKMKLTTKWSERAQTAQTLEILDEILDEKFENHSLELMGLQTLSDAEKYTTDKNEVVCEDDKKVRGLHKTSGTVKSLDISEKLLPYKEVGSYKQDCESRFTSDDTGISSGEEFHSTDSKIYFDGDEDDFWDTMFNDHNWREIDENHLRSANLKRTQKAKVWKSSTENISYLDHDGGNNVINSNIISSPEIKSHQSDETCLLPHYFVYLAYFLCFSGMSVSIFFIILYGHTFGVEKATRWLISMIISLAGSFFVIEPLKALLVGLTHTDPIFRLGLTGASYFLPAALYQTLTWVFFFALYISFFTNVKVPECDNPSIDGDSWTETYENIQNTKIRPPGGFALEQCKQQVKKSSKAKSILQSLAVFAVITLSLACFVYYEHDSYSYWDSWSLKSMLNTNPGSSYNDKNTDGINFGNIKRIDDIWNWTISFMIPKIFNNAQYHDDIGTHFGLLGAIRLRQQRYIREPCDVHKSHSVFGNSEYETCISTQDWDTLSYSSEWNFTSQSSSTPWFFSTRDIRATYYGFVNQYDDSGYVATLHSHNFTEEMHLLKDQHWLDRNTSVLFIEFSHLSQVTLRCIASVLMFEFETSGAIRTSHSTFNTRVVMPSKGVYPDMIFMGLFTLATIFVWTRFIYKIWITRNKSCLYFSKPKHWLTIFLSILSSVIIGIYIYRLVMMEYVINNYLNNKSVFVNFYEISVISKLLSTCAAVQLTILLIEVVRIMRFSKRFSIFGETVSRAWREIICTLLLMISFILAYAQAGYLIFGLNSGTVINEFKDFHHSLYSLVDISHGQSMYKLCFESSPIFSLFYFFSYYFGVIVIFHRLFAVILIAHFKSPPTFLKPEKEIPDYEIIEYIFLRLKMRLGFVKPKQYRHTVHFEGMSTPSSKGSMNSLDSFGTCFTPGRISQCSDASGLSATSSDSGLGTPSNHSISLFDYLTIDYPPTEKPMDSLHLDFIYERFSSYSVDMMLHRFDRVNKLSDDILVLENKILELSQKIGQRKLMQKQSKKIAAAASSILSTCDSLEHSAKKSLDSTSTLLTCNSVHPLSARSMSYPDGSLHNVQLHGEERMKKSSNLLHNRPHSDEGLRVQHDKHKPKKPMFSKRSAW